MSDLYVALALLAVEWLVCLLVTRRLARGWSARGITIAALLVVLVTLLYGFVAHSRTWWALLLPFSNVLVLANGFPAFVGMLTGLFVRHPKIARWKKTTVSALLFGIAVYAAADPLIRTRPAGHDVWSDGVCQQTSEASCSAAAAATLLRSRGIDATEREMIDLCLTDKRGTNALGLYRGLKLKTRGTPYRVRVMLGDFDMLRANESWPVVISSCLPRGYDEDPRYEEDWGWTPGQPHAVVLYGFAPNDRVDIGDPSVGREQWTVADLRVLFRGEAFALTPREPSSPK